jgi:hypothetical protein
VANYTSGFSFSYHILHLEGEEVFGSAKQPDDYPFNAKNDSHCPNCLNFSCPWITVLAIQSNVVDNVSMQQPPCGSNACSPLVSWSA